MIKECTGCKDYKLLPKNKQKTARVQDKLYGKGQRVFTANGTCTICGSKSK